jgi:hypothetical protein
MTRPHFLRGVVIKDDLAIDDELVTRLLHRAIHTELTFEDSFAPLLVLVKLCGFPLLKLPITDSLSWQSRT